MANALSSLIRARFVIWLRRIALQKVKSNELMFPTTTTMRKSLRPKTIMMNKVKKKMRRVSQNHNRRDRIEELVADVEGIVIRKKRIEDLVMDGLRMSNV